MNVEKKKKKEKKRRRRKEEEEEESGREVERVLRDLLREEIWRKEETKKRQNKL